MHQSILTVRLIRISFSGYEDVIFLQKTFFKIPSTNYFGNLLLRHHELKKSGKAEHLKQKMLLFVCP